MTAIDDIRKKYEGIELVPKPQAFGLVWFNMLIKFDHLTGKSEIIRSFSSPAKDSAIKKSDTKAQKEKEKNNIEVKVKEKYEKEELF